MPETQQDKGAVVITGTSTGIGYSTALLLDRSGYCVFAGVRKKQDRDRLRGEGSERLRPLLLDITDQQQIDAAAALVMENLEPEQGLRALINNAGVCEPGPIEFIGIDCLRRQMEVNMIGHVAVIQAFMPLIRKGCGRIINVVSALGNFAMPLLGAYSASKYAMRGISDALRRELRWWGIPVSVIEPGTVKTAMWEDKTIDRSEQFPNGDMDTEQMYREYAHAVNDVMQQGCRVAVKPEALAEVIKKVLEARSPKAQYRYGPGSYMAVIGSRLPVFFTDWLIEKILRKQLPTKLMGWR